MSVTVLHLPYKEEFEPIARSGDIVAIPVGRQQVNYFRVVYVEPVQPILVVEQLSALEQKKEHRLEEIELEENQMGQWRLAPLDFVYVGMNFPRAVSKWSTRSESTYATPYSLYAPQTLEFFTYGDDVPVLYLTNPAHEDQVARVAVIGYRFALEEFRERPEHYVFIPAYSLEYVIGSMR